MMEKKIKKKEGKNDKKKKTLVLLWVHRNWQDCTSGSPSMAKRKE